MICVKNVGTRLHLLHSIEPIIGHTDIDRYIEKKLYQKIKIGAYVPHPRLLKGEDPSICTVPILVDSFFIECKSFNHIFRNCVSLYIIYLSTSRITQLYLILGLLFSIIYIYYICIFYIFYISMYFNPVS